MKKFYWSILPIIILLSFLLGSRMILSGDFFYLFDQARDYLLVKEIVDTHNLVLIGTHSGLGGFFHGPLWLYMLTPVYVLSGGNPFSFTYFYIALQMITILIAYFVGIKLYGRRGGVLLSLLIVLSPGIWGSVANTIGVNVVPLIFLGLFYFLIKFLRGNENSFIFASFFAGLSLQFEAALPLVLFPAMIIIFILNKSTKNKLKTSALSIFAYVLSVSTFIIFDLRHQFLMTSAVLKSFTGGERGKGFLEIGDRIYAHINSLFGTYKSILFKEDTLLILLLISIFIFAGALILKSKKEKSLVNIKKEYFFLILFPVLIFLFLMFYSYPVWPEYVLGLIIPVALAFYIAIITVWRNNLGKALVIIFFTITFLNVGSVIKEQYLQEYHRNNTSGSYLNQKDVVEWIFKDAGKGKFGYFVYTPEVYTHGMDYLISWENKNYPRTVLESKKDKVTYLILYPHMTGDEGAYDFWKKNTLKTSGKTVLKKTFKGGITVEKILIDKGESDVDPNYYQGLLFR